MRLGAAMTAAREPAGRTHLLSVAEAAAHLGVTEGFVRRLVLERRVRFYKVGRYVRFRVGDLNAFVEAGRNDPVEIAPHDLSATRQARAARTAGGETRGVASGGD